MVLKKVVTIVQILRQPQVKEVYVSIIRFTFIILAQNEVSGMLWSLGIVYNTLILDHIQYKIINQDSDLQFHQ